MHRYRSTRKKLLSYSPLRRGFPGPAHCAYPTRARTWTRPGASSRTVEHKEQLFAEPRLVVRSCPAFGRTAATCDCRGLGRVTRLSAASTLGLVGPAKLEADLAGVDHDDGDFSFSFCHRAIHERELPLALAVIRG
jgi:hypothetical protein